MNKEELISLINNDKVVIHSIATSWTKSQVFFLTNVPYINHKTYSIELIEELDDK